VDNITLPDRTPERRKNARFHLRLPVTFWYASSGETAAGGFTRDISLGGIFVLSDECPEPGHPITVQVTFPPLQPRNGQLHLMCAGHVSRVWTGAQQRRGFAVSGWFSDEHLNPASR